MANMSTIQPLPIGTVISLVKVLNREEQDVFNLAYEVVGYINKDNSVYYTIQPSVFNIMPELKEVEDSFSLYVWNEQKQKWIKRNDFGQSS